MLNVGLLALELSTNSLCHSNNCTEGVTEDQVSAPGPFHCLRQSGVLFAAPISMLAMTLIDPIYPLSQAAAIGFSGCAISIATNYGLDYFAGDYPLLWGQRTQV